MIPCAEVNNVGDKTIKNTEYWIIKSFGPRYYSAQATDKNNLCAGEYRIYYSKDALLQDFANLFN